MALFVDDLLRNIANGAVEIFYSNNLERSELLSWDTAVLDKLTLWQ